MTESTGTFVPWENDKFNPEYGGIKWKHRLNMTLEAENATLEAVGYQEKPKRAMQLTQENFHIYINQIADELNCMTILYTPDGEDVWTWVWRNAFEQGAENRFMEIAEQVGQWATQVVTIYPLPHIVEQYERTQSKQIPDGLPEGWV